MTEYPPFAFDQGDFRITVRRLIRYSNLILRNDNVCTPTLAHPSLRIGSNFQ